MLDQPLQRFLTEVEPVEIGVAPFEFGHQSQAVAVVVEAAIGRHAGVERVLADMAEGRVAEVVTERNGFGQIVVEAETARQRARDLRHLDRMGQAGAEMIVRVIDEHLRLVRQPPERGAMHDAVAVALERGSRRRGGLGKEPAARLGGVDGVGRPGRRGIGHERHCIALSLGAPILDELRSN